ncbi:hypothetical protein DNTS_008271 [Danionella cerebrum]|uniref:Uncharacterized protein n=1 Tax=Danionella cerebrum TaxID=2873325 RepID=A0A553R6F9_9TELE|nr:hypothetical protein DNTS_008271 [Danionella translucida]
MYFFSEITRSSELPSSSDLDRGILIDQSLSLSTLSSSDGLQKHGRGVILEYPDSNPVLLPPVSTTLGLLSPLMALNKGMLSPGNSLWSPMERNPAAFEQIGGKSSTPYEELRIQKPTLDVSYIDLTATHPSWEISFVKEVTESPKYNLDSSWSPKPCLETVWSPINPHSSGELQRTWREVVGRGLNLAPVRKEEQRSPNLLI